MAICLTSSETILYGPSEISHKSNISIICVHNVDPFIICGRRFPRISMYKTIIGGDERQCYLIPTYRIHSSIQIFEPIKTAIIVLNLNITHNSNTLHFISYFQFQPSPECAILTAIRSLSVIINYLNYFILNVLLSKLFRTETLASLQLSFQLFSCV